MSDIGTQIREHMDVVGRDGEHVGTVDRVEGDRIKLTRGDDPFAEGEHRYLPLDAAAEVSGDQVKLRMTAEEARAHATPDIDGE
jgi:hypothetical protein